MGHYEGVSRTPRQSQKDGLPDELYTDIDSPDVEFCGYSAPHPSETKIHLRIQMYGT